MCHYGVMSGFANMALYHAWVEALCMDWCCHYGPNFLLFKVDFCWITNEVDYLKQDLIITKEKNKHEILKCP